MNNQKGFANIMLVVIIVAIIAVGGYFVLTNKSQPNNQPPTSNQQTQTPNAQTTGNVNANWHVGSSIVVTGSVVENDTFCIVDAHCILKLSTSNGSLNVLYDPGRSLIQCINREAAVAGLKIKTGDQVEVYGKITDKDSLSTCDSKEFYIKRR